MTIKLWSLCVALIFCFFNQSTCLQNVTDKLALISLKNAIQHDPLNVFSSWNESFHFCNWYRVTCGRRHPDRVVTLNLESLGLVGTLSPHIGNLSFLRYLVLRNNSFNAQIPQEIGRLRRLQFVSFTNNSFSGSIPTNLSRCSNLFALGLRGNKLVGSIPAELGSLFKLRFLDLEGNKLTGSIPLSIGSLSALQELSLLSNGLQGQIPKELSQLQSLTLLILADNNLSGEIPIGLYNLSNLNYFEVAFNKLNGSIPSNIGILLPKLRSVIFGSNMFDGKIPHSLSNASELEEIVFSNNYFTGLIPKNLGKLPHLLVVDFQSNQLQDDLGFIVSLTNCSNLKSIGASNNFLRGSIPTSIANLSKQLQLLQMSGNQLYNVIPLGIENLYNLRFFRFAKNFLSGPILVDFNKLWQLEKLDLNSNKLTGTIPSSIGNLSKLSDLNLAFNNLNGRISPSLGNCHNLIGLSLSHNRFTGSIPQQVIRLSSLSVFLFLGSNTLTGPIPSEVGSLQNLVQLDLSNNRLSGTIPSTIGKCTSLVQLRLEGNSFDGEIPQALSSLQGLLELDLSRNNFSGRIPNSLAELDGLKHLNLSFNQLQGEVPKRGVFLNASAVSLLGNNSFCGGITEFKLPSCPPTNSKKKFPLALKVIIPVVVFAIFLALSGFFLFFLRQKKMSEKTNISDIPSVEQHFLRISFAELFKATDGFSATNIIGVGSYGTVYKGTLEQQGIQIAVKVLNMQRKGATSSFMSECEALRSIRHRNLLKLLSVCSSIDFEGNDFKALIYEFMVNGSLEKWLHTEEDAEQRNLKLIQRLNIAIDVASAIEYLHNGSSSTIIHGDLKPSNVLLDDEMAAHIGDFGLAKIVSSISNETQPDGSSSVAVRGSIGYVAPEYGMGDSVSREGDVYSYGVLLLEIFTGKKPTDEAFKDGLNLHTFVEISLLDDRVMDNVDIRILSEHEGGLSKDCIISTLRIGVACSVDQPGDRMKMRDVISELQKIKGSCQIRGPRKTHF